MKIVTFKCDFCDYEETAEISGGGFFPKVLLLMGNKEACRSCMDKAQKLLEKKGYTPEHKCQSIYAKTLREKTRILEDIETKDGIIVRVDGGYPDFQVTYLPYEYEDR